MLATDELLREGSDPRGVFLEHLRRQIARLADRLALSCEGLPPLDFVQLSGKTAFLPVVREVLSSRFTARIERADEPKECVVRGACLAQTLARGRIKSDASPVGSVGVAGGGGGRSRTSSASESDTGQAEGRG